MPKGMKGFQPGRPKTGGREKISTVRQRRSSKFVDRLRGYGFNYDHELAKVLRDIRDLASLTAAAKPEDVIRRAELKFYYAELKSLLPFMTPKLREKQVEVVEMKDEPEEELPRISDEDLLKAINGQTEEGSGSKTSVGTGAPELPVPESTEENLPDVAGVEEENP